MPSVGVVGSGPWARQVVLPALRGSDVVDLTAIWARDASAAGELAAEHGPRVASTPQELFAAVDVVAFAVPPDVQAPLAVEAARAGCHLLLEKPLARSTGEADALVRAVEASGVRAGVHLSRVLDDAIGGWVSAHAGRDWRRASATVLNGALVTDNPFSRSRWRQELEAPVWDLGPHVLSVLLPLLGRVVSVRAERDGDAARLSTTHAGGGSGTLITSMRAEADLEVFDVGPADGAERHLAEPFDGVDTYARLARVVVAGADEQGAAIVRDLDTSRHAVAVLEAAVASLRADGAEQPVPLR